MEYEPKLKKPIADQSTWKVIKVSIEVLNQVRANGSVTPGLHSHAKYLRDLRNYGAHPRPDEVEPIERNLTESACGLLILETRSYFMILAAAVERRLEKTESNNTVDS